MEPKEKLLITGITGFLGSWVGKYAIEQVSDRFEIRAAVRNPAKAEVFRETYGEDNFNKIEWFEAELTNDESLRRAIEGVSCVLHVASPVPGKNEKGDLVLQAREGMRSILNYCKQFRVKKLIVTSSQAAVSGNNYKGKADTVYDETCFAYNQPGHRCDGYMLSKIEQEQECIRFLKENEGEDFVPEIVTLHPCFIVGPPLNHLASSSVLGVKDLCDGTVPFLPRIQLSFIDVRDIAQAHINALLAEPGSL